MEKVEQPQSVSPLPRRRQFGLIQLLFLVFIVAVGIVAWQKFVFVHPAHLNPEYEKAVYTRSGSIRFDQCRIKMETVLRNDRDGTILFEDGFGNRQTKEAADELGAQAQVLKKSGDWLDTAQIQLSASGGTFEVTHVFAFDFETRRKIAEHNHLSGVWMSGPETVQIHRIGEKLPERVDVLMRVKTYGEENIPTILQPKVGATCKVLGGTIELLELHRGFESYSQKTGVVPAPEEVDLTVALMLSFEGEWPSGSRYQIAAVTKDGTRFCEQVDSFTFPGGCIIEAGG